MKAAKFDWAKAGDDKHAEWTNTIPGNIEIDGTRGLYLEIAPAGGRWWRFKYRFANKEKRISLGVYPDVGLKEARERLDEARKQVAAGIDPGEQRKVAKLAAITNTENNFEAISREWFQLNEPGWVPGRSSKIIGRLESDVFPWIGRRPITQVTAPGRSTLPAGTDNPGCSG